MKKITFLLAVFALAWNAPLKAFDLPEASKDGKIKWYFLQSKLDGEEEPRYWTAAGDLIYGYPKADDTDPEALAKQLWCFEAEEINDTVFYTITCRYDGRRVGVGMGPRGGCPMLMDTVQAKFSTVQNDYGLVFISNTLVPEEPTPGCLYVRMTDKDEGDYIIWLSRAMYANNPGCGVELIEYQDSYAPQNKETVTWYNIANAEDGGSVIADNTSVVDAQYKFTVEGKDKADPNAQWRLVETRPGRVSIINRATKNSISTTLTPQDRYNLPAADDASSAPSWWSLLPAGGGQYAIAATGIDNIRRYLNLQILGDAPNALPESLLIAGTKFAWTFVEAGTENGIDNAAAQEDGGVRIEDGRISAPDGAEVAVFTPEGVRLSPSARLAPGVYIVTVNGRTSKISVH